MTTRRKFVSGCIAASLTPSFAFASTNDPASDFDMKQYVNELNELVSIDSKSGHVEGANKIADILEKRFKSIGWTVTTRDCAGRGKSINPQLIHRIKIIMMSCFLFIPIPFSRR